MTYHLLIKIKCLCFLLILSSFASEPPEETFPSLLTLSIKNLAQIVVEKSNDKTYRLLKKSIDPDNFINDFKKNIKPIIPCDLYEILLQELPICCAEKIIQDLNIKVTTIDYDSVDSDKKSLLHHCAEAQKSWYIQLLLELTDLSINKADIRGSIPLYYAVQTNYAPTSNNSASAWC